MKTITAVLLFISLYIDKGNAESILRARNRRLIGSTVANINEAPHYVFLLDDEQDFGCGGTLISLKHVLTARHCVENGDDPKMSNIKYVLAGEIKINLNGEKRLVKKVYKPKKEFDWEPNYNDRNTTLGDIAIIELNEPFVESDAIKPVQLIKNPVKLNEKMMVFGYGDRDFVYNVKATQLDKLDMNISRCYGNWPIFRDEICTKTTPRKSFCDGDSGSGLINENNEVVGIVSRTLRCGRANVPDIFSSVYFYLNNIQNVLNGKKWT